MKKLILIIFLFVSFIGKAQITKNNWMIGGDAGFYYNTYKNQSTSTSNFSIRLSPNVGYFIYDKLAIGTKINYMSGNSNSTTFQLGPFARYYFLEKNKAINIFLEPSYNFGLDKRNKDYSNFSTKAGTAIFLNSSVALELALNYTTYKDKISNFNSSSLSFGVGFQIHLEREK